MRSRIDIKFVNFINIDKSKYQRILYFGWEEN